MSASREKQNRQAASGQADPKTAREAQQRREEKRTNLLYGVIAAAVLVAVIASFVWRSDFIPKTTTAATIDGEKYTAAEVEYYYQTAYRNFVSNSQYSYFLSYLGLNTNATLKSQSINSTAAAMLGIELPDADAESAEADSEADPLAPTGMTWHDYFLDEALDNMRVIQAALKAAEAEGFQYPAGVQAQYDDNMDALKAVAAASGISVSQYLKGNFGAGVTEKVYGEQLMRVLRYSAYADAYQDSLTYSDSELEDAYGADRNTYDHVSYEVVSFSGAAESTTDDEGNTVEPTEEEAAAALEAAQDLAQTVLDGFQDGGDLEELANENDGTYSKNENGTYSAGSVMSEWLYDSARKSGDASTLADGTVQYVVVFHDRFRDENPTIDIRHILVPLGSGSIAEGEEGYEDEQAQLKADAHAKAEELLAQWQSGEATEDSFAALALKESTDGSKYDGGLYTEVYQGRMVTEFNDWCFDTARQSGDTGVVDTQYGSHVMYFSGVNAARWQTQVAANLRTEAYTAWEEDLVKDVTVQRSESGLKHIG
ncbi:peptidylprolyl isomerase [uncultured Oscillibacter sp.]|uniref:peptidylprolyl isomerase n=1 Tax=uncultured Oscillibacter sp. TaxID=876091 RepID=UPI002605E114|nr:peptidylprolyl isomerase [uncultured Oscillibacter sp.]